MSAPCVKIQSARLKVVGAEHQATPRSERMHPYKLAAAPLTAPLPTPLAGAPLTSPLALVLSPSPPDLSAQVRES